MVTENAKAYTVSVEVLLNPKELDSVSDRIIAAIGATPGVKMVGLWKFHPVHGGIGRGGVGEPDRT